MAARKVDGLHAVPLLEGRGKRRQVMVVQGRRAAAGLDLFFDPRRRHPGGLVRDRRVQRIELVFHEEFPVRVLDHAVAHRHHLDLAFRRAVAHVVEGDPGFTEKLGQRWAGRRQAGEHEAAVAVHPRRGLHREFRVVAGHARALVTLGQRNALHLAVEVKAPGVVGADEGAAGIALEVAAQLHAAVRAAVVQHPHLHVLAAHHDHRLAADGHGRVVAGLFHLRLVAAIDPDLLEDVLDLALENVRVGIDQAVHAVGLDELLQVGYGFMQHGADPLVATGRKNNSNPRAGRPPC